MSEENAEAARKGVDAFNAFMRGDLTGEEAVDLLDPQVEWHWHAKRTFPDLPQHLRGAQAVIEVWEQMGSAWDGLTLEAVEFIEAPPDRILIPCRQTGRGRESGVPLEVHFFQVWTIRDGKCCKVEIFRHRADALEAAGLRE